MQTHEHSRSHRQRPLALLLALAAAAAGCGRPTKPAEPAPAGSAVSASPCEGAKSMSLQSLSDAGDDNSRIEALANSLRASSSATPKAAIELLLGPDEMAASRARLLLVFLGDLAILPLLDAKPS